MRHNTQRLRWLHFRIIGIALLHFFFNIGYSYAEGCDFELTLPSDTIVCKGANLVIKDIVVSGNPTRFFWNGEESSQPDHAIIGITSDMTVTLSASDGVCQSEEKQFEITVRDPLSFTLTPDQSICAGEEASIRIKVRSGKAVDYRYFKQEEGGEEEEFFPEGKNLYETPEKTTTYTITVISDACPSETQKTTVFVDQPQRLELSINGGKDHICKGEEVQFDLLAENCDQLQWEMIPDANRTKRIIGIGADVTKSIILEESALFRVVSLREGICPKEASNEIAIMVDDPLRIKISPMVRTYCVDDEIHFEADLYSGKTETLGWKKITENESTEIAQALVGDDKATESAKYVAWAESPTCPTATDTVEILVESTTTPSIQSSLPIICAGEELTLSGSFGSAIGLKWQRREEGEPIFKTISTELSESIIDTPQRNATYCLVTSGLTACPEKWSEPIQVQVVIPAELTLEAVEKVCQGESTTIKLTTDIDDPSQVQWERINSTGKTILHTSTQKIRETLDETTTYVVSTSSEICSIITDTIVVVVDSIPDFQVTASTDSICEGEELLLTTDFPYAEKLKWEKSKLAQNSYTVIAEGQQEVSYLPNEPAKYRLTAQTEFGCMTQAKPIIVNLSRAIITQLGDTTICEGDQLDLSFLVNNVYKYEWASDPDFSQKIPSEEMVVTQPKESETYYLRIRNGICKKEMPIHITVSPYPNIIDAEIVGFHSIRVSAEGGTGNFQYNFGQGFGDSDVFEHARYSNTYKIQVRDDAGCMTDTILHTPECEIEIPIVFTPNGDGINDLYVIKNLDKFLTYKLRIYDRRGQFIYQQDENSEPWDGTYKGKALPSADYWYTIDIEEEDDVYSGHFTLIR